MYVHLGQSAVLPHREILGIFDLDNASWAYKTREFLERAEREGRTIWLTEDLPRSFILAGGKESLPKVYMSPLTAATILGRMRQQSIEEF